MPIVFVPPSPSPGSAELPGTNGDNLQNAQAQQPAAVRSQNPSTPLLSQRTLRTGLRFRTPAEIRAYRAERARQGAAEQRDNGVNPDIAVPAQPSPLSSGISAAGAPQTLQRVMQGQKQQAFPSTSTPSTPAFASPRSASQSQTPATSAFSAANSQPKTYSYANGSNGQAAMTVESEMGTASGVTSPLTDVPASPLASAANNMVDAKVEGETENAASELAADDPLAILNAATPKMPGLGDTFRTRAAFESACRDVVPADATWKMRVYSSRDESTARRDTLPAFVELGCTHSGERTCSTLNFRIKALKKGDHEWVVVKANTLHDRDGWPPTRPNKRKLASTMTPEPDLGPRLRSPNPDNLPYWDSSARHSPRRPKRQVVSADYVNLDNVPTKPVHVPRIIPTLYCYCVYPSYDRMAKCADPKCTRQWFHLGCIGYADMPSPEWKCFDCSRHDDPEAQVPVPRLADKPITSQMPDLAKRISLDYHPERCPHGPMLAFLNSLNPTLGDATAKILYDHGLTAPMRFQQLSLEQWNEFLTKTLTLKLTPFDHFTLDRTIRNFIQNGRTRINMVV